ncbi:hypothetical protein [Limimaricola cinnabarinus]|uniref:Uncharacterized protein n=1 Tax=Limimaricola cinnabarinus TaxID=1125964 RepID=A0A2G1MFS2_9RHOB|nr:hypothetical protein [Limimaricola cinnabarinus]PHP27527.1 hypothetical protein CJ301_10225 [Limimaricola cinnabarinus]
MADTCSTVMRRAWAKMHQHMQHNRFTRFLMARFLRDAWAEVKAAARNIVQPSELSPIEHAIATLEGQDRLSPKDWEDLAALRRERAQQAIQLPQPAIPSENEWLALWGLMFLSRRHAAANQSVHPF